MVNFDYDCSGWATKANVRCYDGLVIAQDAFKECSGKVVPMVYNHDHSNVDNVIGHCLLENRPGGVYCYAKFNDTDTGKTARQCVESGDLSAFSIFANGLKKVGSTVKHGFIREVSLVLAGCNPGALIDEVVKHSADEDYEGGEAFIYNEDGLSLTHGMDPEGNPLEDLTHSADSGDAVTDDEATQEEAKMADEKNEGKTLEQVYNSMTDEQKECCHALVGLALEEQEGGDNDDGEEDDTVKQNVFDKDTNATVLKHSIEEINNVVKTAKSHGTMKAAFEDAGMEIDLGGIAKGYTSSRIMEIFKEYDVDSGLVNLGGNVQTYRTKTDGSKWRVAVQSPEDESQYIGVIDVSDKAVITSGGYVRYFEQDGKIYHHIIDPATGYPAESGLKSVTIVSDDGTLADGLSTSLFIMGKDKACEFWKAHSDEFDFVLLTDDDNMYISAGIAADYSSDHEYEVISAE